MARTPLIALLALFAPAMAAAQDAPARCHLDNPAPYFAEIARPDRPRDAAPPACAPAASAADAPAEFGLPMPCGHQMWFRRVDVAVRDRLDHQQAFVGDSNAGDRTVLNRITATPRVENLSGSFFREHDGRLVSHYYIGKYEVTQAQWRLFEQGLFDRGPMAFRADHEACAAHAAWLDQIGASPLNAQPATGLSWFDAIAFSRAYTAWVLTLDQLLVKNGSRPLMPWSGGTTGFIRLPSEVEWEFAARGGGDSVSREALSAALHRVRDDAGEIVAPRLADVAQTEGLEPGVIYTRGVGRLKPNLLGMHDTIGNASELVLDLFSPTRPDGLKGQLGGAILRGGSTLTEPALLGIGHRQEARLFSSDGPIRDAVAGARFAIAAPFFVDGVDPGQPWATGRANTGLFEQIETALDALTRGGDALSQEQAALQELTARAAEQDLPAAAQRVLRDAMQVVETTTARRVQAERDGLRDRYLTAAGLAVGLNRTERALWTAMQQLDTWTKDRSKRTSQEWERSVASWPDAQARIAGWEQEIDAFFSSYVDILASIAQAPKADRDTAAEKATGRAAVLGSDNMARSLASVLARVAAIDGQAAPSTALREAWRRELDQSLDERRGLIKNFEGRFGK